VSRATAAAYELTTLCGMDTKEQYQLLPAPPLGRNWTDADVCAFHGFRSIELLMKMPGFPTPLPYPMKGRRWRPEDHITFRDRLMEPRPFPDPDSLPRLNLVEFMTEQEQRPRERRNGR
jgi:hypothetical protein